WPQKKLNACLKPPPTGGYDRQPKPNSVTTEPRVGWENAMLVGATVVIGEASRMNATSSESRFAPSAYERVVLRSIPSIDAVAAKGPVVKSTQWDAVIR